MMKYLLLALNGMFRCHKTQLSNDLLPSASRINKFKKYIQIYSVIKIKIEIYLNHYNLIMMVTIFIKKNIRFFVHMWCLNFL